MQVALAPQDGTDDDPLQGWSLVEDGFEHLSLQDVPDIFSDDDDDLDDDDDDCDDHSRRHPVAALQGASKTALAVGGESEGDMNQQPARGKPSAPFQKRREEHEALIRSSGLAGFQCNCPVAKEFGFQSCLDRFTRPHLLSFHQEVYGTPLQLSSQEKYLNAVHKKMWDLRTDREGSDAFGRSHKIEAWKVGGHTVCREGWKAAYGVNTGAYRSLNALTLRGHAPQADMAARLARKTIKQLARKTSEKFEWATTWWIKHLMLQDFLPNELAIQYRGPNWQTVYNTQFVPQAKRAMMELKIRQWRRACAPSLRQLAAEYYPTEPQTKLKLVRSARHSKFPECDTCQKTRKEWIKVLSSSSSAAEQIEEKYQEMLAHQKEWQLERKTALAMKFASSKEDSTTLYQGDDKCGSHWISLPVGETGRDCKATAKAKYDFAIHANVVYGDNGLQRFVTVPKSVTTGASFGLTNLMRTLEKALDVKRLKPHVKTLYRHTDGGSDNVAKVTHVVHWLLVYVGAFDEIIWFRFEAGHSHTELADRLFALLKSLFTSDNQSRALGVESIPE
ncbi:MAG: hypothetical protein AAF417_23105, partial [Pseudomonadota bacterium]